MSCEDFNTSSDYHGRKPWTRWPCATGWNTKPQCCSQIPWSYEYFIQVFTLTIPGLDPNDSNLSSILTLTGLDMDNASSH